MQFWSCFYKSVHKLQLGFEVSLQEMWVGIWEDGERTKTQKSCQLGCHFSFLIRMPWVFNILGALGPSLSIPRFVRIRELPPPKVHTPKVLLSLPYLNVNLPSSYSRWSKWWMVIIKEHKQYYQYYKIHTILSPLFISLKTSSKTLHLVDLRQSLNSSLSTVVQ